MKNIFFDLKKLKYLGKNCIIGKTVRIRKPEECYIGDGSIIDDFTYISCSVEIGNFTHIASGVSISGGNGKFRIGNYSTISNQCSIHCASSDYSIVSLDLPSVPKEFQFGGEIKDICLGDFVTIGSHSCILPGSIIPDGFACGAYSLIKKSEYLPWSLYAGIPAKILKARDKNLFLNSVNYKNLITNQFNIK